MKFEYKYINLLAILIPLIFFFTGINFNRAHYINDPNYIYLMNALCICNGQSIGNIDNPGTTVMQTGALTIAALHLFSNPENETLINHVLKDPEKFVEGIRIFILFLNALVLFLIGFIAIKKSGSPWLALLLQASTLMSSNTLDHIWTKLSPEPMLFFITGIYVLTVLIFYFEENKNRWKYVLLFALITGAGLGTKATFLPLIVFPFIAIPTIRKKAAFLSGIIPAFVLFTIPAIPEYENLFFWMRNLFIHKGIYGHGEAGIIDSMTYLPNMGAILRNNPLISFNLVCGTIVSGVLLLTKKDQKIRLSAKFLIGLVATMAFGVLLVAKHFKDHYIIPVQLLNGVTLFFILKGIVDIFNLKFLKSYLVPAASIVLLAIVLYQQPRKMKETNQHYLQANIEIDSTNRLIEKEFAGYTRINYYIFSMNKFTALKFGNDFAKQKIRSNLEEVYPYTYFFEFPSNQYIQWNQMVQLKDIIERHGTRLLLMNGPADDATVEDIGKTGFPLQRVYSGNAQNLYILDTLKYKSIELNQE